MASEPPEAQLDGPDRAPSSAARSTGRASLRARLLASLATVAAVRLLVSLALIGLGFEAVSDDDFARVSLAQRWAAAPVLDPTGTSWLPAPFWMYGTALATFGRSLAVARAFAVLLATASALLLYATARVLGARRRAAVLGAIIASLFPYGAILGAAAVPELPTAALTAFGIATLCRPRPWLRVAGALALLLACLSRYEPWLVAIGFALLTVADMARGTLASRLEPLAVASDRRSTQSTGADGRGRALGGVAALLSLAGPAGWIAHNAVVHADPLHFLRRVSAYRQAVGQGGASVTFEALVAYPLAILQKEPELSLVAALLALFFVVAGRRPLLSPDSRRALGLALWLVVGLSLAAARGGAATHHAERALLTIWLLASLWIGVKLDALRTLGGPSRRLIAWLGLTAAVVLGALVLRPWFGRLDSFAHRADEVAAGQAAARRVAPPERILLEVRDYGYFAILAGSGRPELFVLDREPDPRQAEQPSSFAQLDTLCGRARSLGARFALAVPPPGSALAASLGPPLEQRGSWALWELAVSCERP